MERFNYNIMYLPAYIRQYICCDQIGYDFMTGTKRFNKLLPN